VLFKVEEEINSEDLVPGDIMLIQNMSTMQCDALLLNGNVIVNESMLTGESVPVTKTPFVTANGSIKIEMKEHNMHLLYCGTQVIQLRQQGNEPIKALVLRTGFNTAKGELIRAILFPKPVDYRLNNDVYKYLAVLAIVSVAGMAYTIVIKVQRQNSASEIIRRALDLVAVLVPPGLPGYLATCLIYAQNRLKKSNIFCISPKMINMSGSVDLFVFDKTGTLTEDGMDIKCIVSKHSSTQEIQKIEDFSSEDEELFFAMASCHSLAKIDDELFGDPLELKMFEFTKCKLDQQCVSSSNNLGNPIVNEDSQTLSSMFKFNFINLGNRNTKAVSFFFRLCSYERYCETIK
jgi:cation-transporting P-type ATPase 13A2